MADYIPLLNKRLSWNVSVPTESVTVKVEKGWVTLTGQVDWWFQKDEAEKDIKPLRGVVGVSNRTTIQPRVDTASLGDDITHALHRSWFFDPSTVHVRAEGVHSYNERQVATRTAWAAPGATMVEIDLAVI